MRPENGSQGTAPPAALVASSPDPLHIAFPLTSAADPGEPWSAPGAREAGGHLGGAHTQDTPAFTPHDARGGLEVAETETWGQKDAFEGELPLSLSSATRSVGVRGVWKWLGHQTSWCLVSE